MGLILSKNTVNQPNLGEKHCIQRRQRVHELLIALINRQDSFNLMDDDSPISEIKGNGYPDGDPAAWLERNRRVINQYQALVRSAVTLDALLDAEGEGIA